jgi:hypothetical protein
MDAVLLPLLDKNFIGERGRQNLVESYCVNRPPVVLLQRRYYRWISGLALYPAR